MKSYFNFIFLFILISLYLISLSMFVVAGEMVIINLIVLSIAIIMTVMIALYKRKSLIVLIKSSYFKKATSNLVTVILSFLILSMINYLVVKKDYTFDFTKTKIHSLSEQSKNVAKGLAGGEIKLTLFAKREDWSRYLQLLKLYQAENSKISVKAIDVDKEPALVSLNEITHNGTLLVEYQGKTYKSVLKDELGVTNLLLKVLRPKKMILYVVTGHNEMNMNENGANGLSSLKGMILGANYELKYHDLAREVPKDASAIILFNPQTSFLKSEIKNLDLFFLRGGSAVITMAPRFNQKGPIVLNQVFKKLGVRFENGIILDRLSATQGGEASIPIVNSYQQEHGITKGFQGRTVFPVSGFFTQQKKSTYKWNIIAESTPFPGSWGEMNFDEVKSGKTTYQEETDFKGPLGIVLAGRKGEGKIALFSSSSFISNQFQGQTNNFNLFLNSLSWVIGDESLVSLNRPKLEGNLIYISDMHLSLVFYLAIICFPFVFFGIAIFSYRVKLGR